MVRYNNNRGLEQLGKLLGEIEDTHFFSKTPFSSVYRRFSSESPFQKPAETSEQDKQSFHCFLLYLSSWENLIPLKVVQGRYLFVTLNTCEAFLNRLLQENAS